VWDVRNLQIFVRLVGSILLKIGKIESYEEIEKNEIEEND